MSTIDEPQPIGVAYGLSKTERARRFLHAMESVHPDHIKKVPVPRLARPLPWDIKLRLALKKMLPGFLTGLVGGITTSAQAGTLWTWNTLVQGLLGGVLGAFGLGGYKYAKETMKDRKLEKEVRKPLRAAQAAEDGGNLVALATMVEGAMMLIRTLNAEPRAALRQVALNMRVAGRLPAEAGEAMLVIAEALSPEGPGGSLLTAEEVLSIIDEAMDVKEAVKAIIDLRASKEE